MNGLTNSQPITPNSRQNNRREGIYAHMSYLQRSHRVVVRHFDPITEYGTAHPWSDYAHTATFGQL